MVAPFPKNAIAGWWNVKAFSGSLFLRRGAILYSEVCSEEDRQGLEVKEQAGHRYAAIHIERPFDNPFCTIPGAYQTLGDYMRTNGLSHVENEVIPCFESDEESVDVYLACK